MNLFRLRQKLYIFEMARYKQRIRQETKERMYRDVVEECRKIVNSYDEKEPK